MVKQRERNYTMGDDPMLERAQVFHDQLNGELADFTARFPWLDAIWLAAFQADITAADAFPKDESVTLDIKVLTGDVTASMQQGYAALLTLGGYARLAYPTDPAREKVFGQQYWANSRDNTLKLQEALELAHAKADSASFKPDLLAKGYTQAEIDQLASLAADLQTKNGLQEALKVGRHVTKADRIALLNVVWGHMLTINTCASVVWAADAERKGVYNMYPSSAGGSGSGDGTSTTITLGGMVTNMTTATPLENATVLVYPTVSGPTGSDPSAVTNIDGTYGFTFDDVEEAWNITIEASLAGYVTQSILLEAEPGNDYPGQNISLTPNP